MFIAAVTILLAHSVTAPRSRAQAETEKAWAIPLTVREYDGYGKIHADICNGVPLLPGQATDVSELRLLDAEGQVVPAQFKVLARWPGKSTELYNGWGAPAEGRSIRWVLVDFQASLNPFETQTYSLTNGGPVKAESPLKVTETDDTIIIDTGAAEFQINRKHFNLLDRARIDVNGDGQYTEDEELISPSPKNGSVVEDTYGNRYSSTAGTEVVRVEEAGPVRVCILARGHHRPVDGEGYSRGMNRFEIRMYFFANSTTVKLDPVIENNEPTSNGAPTFEDYSLLTKVNIGPAVNTNPEGDWATHGPVSLYRVYGVAPIDGELRAGESVTLYQDSNGSETWQINPGIVVRGEDQHTIEPSTFRGYRITKHAAGNGADEELASGDHAWGITAVSGEKFGVVVVPRYFWKKFPKAISVSQDGSVRLGILPREYSQAHWIADGGGAGMETWLHFYARGYEGKGHTFPRDRRTKSPWWNLFRDRPWPHVVAYSVDPPLYALATPEHYGATGALADIGPYMPIHEQEDFPEQPVLDRYFMTDYLKGNAYGWQSWGCRWEEAAGHSPWNYEPIATNDFAWRFINTGTIGWRNVAYPRLRHFSEVRCYRVADAPRWNYPDFKSLAANTIDEEWGKRPVLKDEEAQKYTQGKYGRVEWPLPNPEHMGLDGLHDAYLFYGSQRAFEGMKYPAAFGGGYMAYTQPGGKIGPNRSFGWSFRCLLMYLQLTGDPDAADYLEKSIANFWKMAREQRQLAGAWPYDNNWMYGITTRSIVLGHQLTADERLRDLAIGLARHYPPTQDTNYHRWNDPLVTAFAWTQTGLEEFYDLERAKQYAGVMGDNQWVYYPSCASWLWFQPRPDKTPPSAVSDLSASTEDGQVTLSWTAPGGDGREGAASIYQIKYDDAPLGEVSDGSKTVNFWTAQNVPDEPKPDKAGNRQTYTIKNLPPGEYYFAIKSRDQQDNESPISNIVKVQLN